jgi:hypothetical protein
MRRDRPQWIGAPCAPQTNEDQKVMAQQGSSHPTNNSQRPPRRRRVLSSVGQTMATAMSQIGENIGGLGAGEPGRNVSERASKILQEEYGESMQDEDLHKATLILENDLKGAFGFDGHGSVRFSGSSDSQRETDDGVKRTFLEPQSKHSKVRTPKNPQKSQPN